MCVNIRPIVNKYTGKTIYVKCGYCKACQQEKAHKRKSKIINHLDNTDYVTLFVTLNYSSEYLPVCKFSDLLNCKMEGKIYVYRKMDIFRQYIPKIHTYKIVRKTNNEPIGSIEFSSHNRKHYCNLSDFDGIQSPTKYYDFEHFGICYSPDFTNFIKRLKINLKRYYGIELTKENFSYYRVSEYGPTFLRPHFHVLLHFTKGLFKNNSQSLRRAIMQSWLFCSRSQMQRNIEIAIKPASYVSSYVNSGSSFPLFFRSLPVRPKGTSSQGYGFGNISFTFDNIRENTLSSVATYSRCVFIPSKGYFTYDFLYPEYVCRRYFPKLPGFSQISYATFSRLTKSLYFDTSTSKEVSLFLCTLNGKYDYNSVLPVVRTFKNKIFRICEENNITIYDYLFLHQKFYSLRSSTVLRMSFSNDVDYNSLWSHYFNIDDVVNGVVDSDMNQDIPLNPSVIKSYTNSERNILETRRYEEEFDKNMKQRKLNEYSKNIDNYTFKSSIYG